MKINHLHRKFHHNYTVLSIFSGAGGLDLGFEAEGFKLLGAIDNNPWCIKTIQYNRPQWNAILGDVCTYNPPQEAKPDVLLAGVPCQGFSLGGERNNRDPRNLLYQQVLRLANICQPRVIIIENVLNLRTMNAPHTGVSFAQQIATELEDIGYEVLSDIFKLSYYGVPQTRRRFVFVAFRSGRPPCYFLPRPESETTIRDYLYDLAYSQTTDLPNHQPNWGFKSTVHQETGAPFEPSEPIFPVRLSRTASDGNPIRSFDAPFPAVDTATLWGWAQGNVIAARYHKDRQNGKFVRNPAADVTLWRISASRLRAFTPREYARLQTFPDDWVFLGGNKRDIQQQIGNAVPVQFARKLARNVRIALAALDKREAFFDDMAEGNLLLF